MDCAENVSRNVAVTLAETSRVHVVAAVGTSYAAMMSLAVAINLSPVILSTLQRDLGGLRNEQLGRVGGVTFVGLVGGVLATGPLADRFGAKPFAVGGNALIAAGLVLLASSAGYAMLLASVFCMGLGAGILDMVLSPVVAALRPHRKTEAMNWLHSFYAVGAVVTSLAASVALRWGIDWRKLALLLLPMPVIVGAAFALLCLPALVPEGGPRDPLRFLLRRPTFVFAMGAIFFAGATELGMAQWLPYYAEHTLGYPRWVGGAALVGFSVALALGRFFTAILGRWLSGITLMLWGCWSSAGLFLVACFWPHPGLALAACIAVGFSGSGLWPSMLAVTADQFPRGGASMYGVLAALGNAGGIFIPWGVGVLADASNLRWGLATATLCPLLMIGSLTRLRTSRGRAPIEVAT